MSCGRFSSDVKLLFFFSQAEGNLWQSINVITFFIKVYKPRMRVVPRRPSASIQAHTQARLPFTQPTMQLSFKFQSRNLRGLAISLQKLSAGFVTHAASSRTIGREPAASGLAGVDSFVLFESTRYGSGPTMHLSIAKLAHAGAGAEISVQTHAGARDRSIANLQASRIRCEEVTCMLARV